MITLVCVCMCFVCWLLLVKFSVLAKRLARKTPLRMHLRGKEIISTKPRPRALMTFDLLCCFVVLLSVSVILLWHNIAFIVSVHVCVCACVLIAPCVSVCLQT